MRPGSFQRLCQAAFMSLAQLSARRSMILRLPGVTGMSGTLVNMRLAWQQAKCRIRQVWHHPQRELGTFHVQIEAPGVFYVTSTLDGADAVQGDGLRLTMLV